MTDIAPRTVILAGGSQDGLTVDVAIDQNLVTVPAYDARYADLRAVGDPRWAQLMLEVLAYKDTGRVSGSGYPIFELVA